jgi:hypothetical protein
MGDLGYILEGAPRLVGEDAVADGCVDALLSETDAKTVIAWTDSFGTSASVPSDHPVPVAAPVIALVVATPVPDYPDKASLSIRMDQRARLHGLRQYPLLLLNV